MYKIMSVLFIGSLLAFNSLASEKASLSEKSLKEMNIVLNLNEELHEAFFKNEKPLVEQKAQSLSAAVKEISEPEIKKLLELSRKQIEQIKADRDPEENNQAYHQFSMALGHVIRKYDISNDYALYSCPMVKKKWLQNVKKNSRVQNPYSSSMPACGGKEETL